MRSRSVRPPSRRGATLPGPGRRGDPRAAARGGTWHARSRRRGGTGHERVHPPRCQGGGALGDRCHGPQDAAPAGSPAGPSGGRVLRRPRGGELRRPPPTRRGPLRGRDDQDHGRDHTGLPDPAVPGVRPPVPAGGADRGDHALQRRRVADVVEDGRCGLATDPGPGACRRRRGRGRAGPVVPAPPCRAGASVRPRHAVAGGNGVLVRVRRDRGPAAGDRRRQGRHGRAAPDGPPGVRRRRIRQDGGRGAGRLQGGARRHAGCSPGPDDVAGEPARPDLRGALRALSGAGGAAQPVPLAGPAACRRAGPGRRERRRGHRHAPALGPGRAVQGARASSWSTRSNASVCRTRRP